MVTPQKTATPHKAASVSPSPCVVLVSHVCKLAQARGLTTSSAARICYNRATVSVSRGHERIRNLGSGLACPLGIASVIDSGTHFPKFVGVHDFTQRFVYTVGLVFGASILRFLNQVPEFVPRRISCVGVRAFGHSFEIELFPLPLEAAIFRALGFCERTPVQKLERGHNYSDWDEDERCDGGDDGILLHAQGWGSGAGEGGRAKRHLYGPLVDRESLPHPAPPGIRDRGDRPENSPHAHRSLRVDVDLSNCNLDLLLLLVLH